MLRKLSHLFWKLLHSNVHDLTLNQFRRDTMNNILKHHLSTLEKSPLNSRCFISGGGEASGLRQIQVSLLTLKVDASSTQHVPTL